jgi:nucleoside-triphosphatase THEP1
MRLVWVLKERGVKVGGIVSRELRTNNMRIGFEFIDLSTDTHWCNRRGHALYFNL